MGRDRLAAAPNGGAHIIGAEIGVDVPIPVTNAPACTASAIAHRMAHVTRVPHGTWRRRRRQRRRRRTGDIRGAVPVIAIAVRIELPAITVVDEFALIAVSWPPHVLDAVDRRRA